MPNQPTKRSLLLNYLSSRDDRFFRILSEIVVQLSGLKRGMSSQQSLIDTQRSLIESYRSKIETQDALIETLLDRIETKKRHIEALQTIIDLTKK